jgi:hypothetical protein
VIQVAEPNGTPAFFVDRQSELVAIVAPDGTVIGRFVYDAVGVAQRAAPDGIGSATAHMAGIVLGSTAPALIHRLVDDRDRPLCQLDWTLKPVGPYEDRRWVPVGYTMRLRNIAPEHLRTVLFASLIGAELMAPTM